MMVDLLFEVEKFLSIIVTAVALGAFFFTLRHRKYYSCWARSAILLGAVIEFYSSYNCFLCYPELTELLHTKPHQAIVIAQIGYSSAVALFIYTILRFKWSMRTQYKRILQDLKQHK